MIKISRKHLKHFKNENQAEYENEDQERKMKIMKEMRTNEARDMMMSIKSI